MSLFSFMYLGQSLFSCSLDTSLLVEEWNLTWKKGDGIYLNELIAEKEMRTLKVLVTGLL